SHLTEWEVAPRYLFGDRLTNYFTVEALYAIDSDVRQALTRDNVFISDQRGEYLQLGTVSSSRRVVLRREEPVTLQGIHIQQSFTGTCRAVDKLVSDIEEQCTFTPALVVDPESIDPDFLFPARIEQPGSLGDVISPETLEILRLPGFQNEGVNGEVVGLDLLFPNVGAIPNPELTGEVDRREQINVLPALTFSRVRQVVKANNESAKVGRTIHGFTGIIGDREFGLNSAVQGAAQALPDFVPDLKGSDEPTNPNVNKTLFISANNTRLPAESFTAYHGGIGRAKHQLPGESVPPARFHGVWLGLSPVTERSLFTTSRFANIGPSRTIVAAGDEGGPEADISFLSVADGQTFSSDDITDFYAQIYVAFLERDADSVATQILSETTTYYPHFSFTGNFTDLKQVFRYYGGAIAAKRIKPYFGVDYTRSNPYGWRGKIGAIGYINPDRDYFSKVDGIVSKRFSLAEAGTLTFSGSFRYALNRPTGADASLSDPADNFISAGVTYRFRRLSLGLTQFFGDLLEESTPTALGGNISWTISRQFTLSGYLLPQDNLTSYGAIASFRLSTQPNSLALNLQWNRDDYRFGSLGTQDDRFTVQLRVGAPSNPFDTVVAPELPQAIEDEAELTVPRPGDPDYDESQLRP
ncbi:MAG: hypothetical protein AAFY15_04105, partial [Cyanobacteria bacterium J06648_11]